ncbi:hypothetical protein WA026_006733 [Henosepilachna vigintioctopunctata]|uniref:Uncharacterized protein n=1 Tax=Henosepilachna vigintioctopunctata TaxID=420089 RepID=A0AAW1U7J6_9CUCU
MNFSLQHISSVLNVAQCLNIILQQYTTSSDLIYIISKKNHYKFPAFRFDYSAGIDTWDYNIRNLETTNWYFYPNRPDLYIFDDLTDNQIKVMIRNLINDLSFNAEAKYIFLSSNFSTDILELLSKKFILKTLFIDVVDGKIFTHFPYNENSWINNDPNFQLVGLCSKTGELRIKKELFSIKIPKLWKDARLSAIYSYSEVYSESENIGVDIEAFNMISKYFNITVLYCADCDLKLFHENIRNVFFGAQFIQDFEQFTKSYLQIEIAVFVPTPRVLPRWKYLSSIFQLNVWSLLFVSVAIISFVWILIDISHNRFSFRRNISEIIATFRWFLEQGFDVKRKDLSNRF